MPFALAETEIDATVVLLVDVPAVRLSLETPDGTLVNPAQLAALGAPVTAGTNMLFCRVALPLPGRRLARMAEHGTAVLGCRPDRSEARDCQAVARRRRADGRATVEVERLQAHGPRYSVTVNTWSNLRMTARAAQTSFAVGATLRLSAQITEFGLPVDRVRVDAAVASPDGTMHAVALAPQAPGAFRAELVAGIDGVWKARVRARGWTRAGRLFTREQLVSAVILAGGSRPQPPTDDEHTLECLVRCLLEEPGGKRWLEERGIDARTLLACLARCRTPDAKELDSARIRARRARTKVPPCCPGLG